MEKEIEKILEDVYLIDPELKKHEDDLKKILTEIIQKKPDTKFDESFKEELKIKLLSRAEDLIAEKNLKANWFSGIFMVKNFSYAVFGAGLVIFILAPVLFLMSFQSQVLQVVPKNEKASQKQAIFTSGIHKAESNAFGKLSSTAAQASNAGETAAVSRSSAPMALGMGGGGGGTSASGVSTVSTDSSVATSKMMMPYNPEKINYIYIYDGQDFSLKESSLPVFKRIKDNDGGQSLAGVLKNLNFGFVDLAKFENLKVNNLNLTEDKEFGYMLSVNLDENSISISENWLKWPNIYNNCQDEACFAKNRLQPGDVPADDQVISVAQEFLTGLGVDMSYYGTAYVQDAWRVEYARAEDKSNAWVPDSLNVVFPLVINGQTVYDTGGERSGLNVSVDIRNMKVSGVFDIIGNNYDSSSYEAITDTDVVMKSVKSGGYQNYLGATVYDNPDKTVEIKLDSPTIDLVRYYNYSNEKGTTEELFVPALIFPVKSVSDDTAYFYRKSIIVPLAKEIFEADNNRILPVPMPLSATGAEGVSSGEVGTAVEGTTTAVPVPADVPPSNLK
jgi:hypothetical protein